MGLRVQQINKEITHHALVIHALVTGRPLKTLQPLPRSMRQKGAQPPKQASPPRPKQTLYKCPTCALWNKTLR